MDQERQRSRQRWRADEDHVLRRRSTPCARRSRRSSSRALRRLASNVTIKSVDASVFFSSDAGNNDTATPLLHRHRDVYQRSVDSVSAGLHGLLVGRSVQHPPEVELLVRKQHRALAERRLRQGVRRPRRRELDPDQAGTDLFIRMNDLVINQVVEIPLVQRNSVPGANKKLQNRSSPPGYRISGISRTGRCRARTSTARVVGHTMPTALSFRAIDVMRSGHGEIPFPCLMCMRFMRSVLAA